MKIMVINPNTSVSMTDHLRKELMKIKRRDTELTVTCPSVGPVSIESAFDEALAVPPTLELVKKANNEGHRGGIQHHQPQLTLHFICMSAPCLATSSQF